MLRSVRAACFGALSWLVLSSAHAQLTRPEIAAKAYLLYDLTSAQVLAENRADAPVEPASLTKLMSAYLVFQALKDGRLTLEQTVKISDLAVKAGSGESSSMVLRKDQRPTAEDLIKGMIVQSGNDATTALAEVVGGTVQGFVDMMNRQAVSFNMKSTTFKNPEGLPAPGHTTTARDLVILAQHLMKDFPDRMHYYKMKSFTYNRNKQDNRNLLLWRDPTVDGLKTGFTEAAGYCLMATASRDVPSGQRRLLSVVLGAASKEARANESQKLLNWGYIQTETIKLFDAQQAISVAKVWKGSLDNLPIGTLSPVQVALPRGQQGKIRTEITRNDPLLAPIAKGQVVGTLKVINDADVLARLPIVALENVERAGWFGQMWDSIRLLFN